MTSSPLLTNSLINIEEAKTNLTTLISQVEKGEEIIITQDGIPVAKIVPYKESKEPRPLRIDRGKFTIPDDFDAPLPDEIINNKEINCMNNNITYTNQIEHKQLIQQQIQNELPKLSLAHLKTILDFTTYLSEQESEAATQEIRKIPGIMELLEITESQAKAGHLIDWEDTEDDI